MKLGRAVEISPKVLMVQFTSWERMSQAASADSVQLSTWFTRSDSTFSVKMNIFTLKTLKIDKCDDRGVGKISAPIC